MQSGDQGDGRKEDTLRFHFEAARSLRLQGRLDEAEAALRTALSIRSDHFGTLYEMGRVCLYKGRRAEAVRWLGKAVESNPKSAEAHNELGIALAQASSQNNNVAAAQFEAALKLKPDFFQAHNNFGNALDSLNRHEEAIVCFERALALQPEFAPALYNCGRALAALERHEEAVRRYREAIACNRDYVAAYSNLGVSLHFIDRTAEAFAAFDKALALDPAYANAYIGRGNIFLYFGRSEEARAAFERAVALAPKNPAFHRALADSKHFHEDDPQLEAMEALAREISSFDPKDQTDLHFALAKAYDDLKRTRGAFEHLQQGNTLKRASIAYDENKNLQAMAAIASLYTPALMAAKRGLGNPSETPVFIVGMPRSGTSLVEQMLASHPCAFGAGEPDNFSKCIAEENPGGRGAFDVPRFSGETLRRIGSRYMEKVRALAPKALRIADKMPGNYFYAGLIYLTLPKARIIHVRRDPADTCFSCYSKLFTTGNEFTYDLGELGRYYKAYEALMAHWRTTLPASAMLEVDYETLVSDFAAQARRIVEFCGLEWSERCLEFYLNQRSVRTASAFQVRRPVYASSVGRWRPYKDELRPLLDALGIRQGGRGDNFGLQDV